jgi:hypothetical protein
MMTAKQQSVLEAMGARPDYWITEPGDLIEATGLTYRGVLIVLYHLNDAGLAYCDEYGWHLKDR